MSGNMSHRLERKDEWPTRAVEAYRRIREIIFSADANPGSLLIEAELVRDLGMSRTPVREALHRLEVEGLLASVPRGGYAIVEFDADDVRDLYEIRSTLEGLAASLAADRMTRVDLAQLEDRYISMSAAVEQNDDEALADLNRQFHRALALASGNVHLVRMLDDIKSAFERFRTRAVSNPDRRREAHAEHGALIEALREHRGEAAREVAEAHVRNAYELGTFGETPAN